MLKKGIFAVVTFLFLLVIVFILIEIGFRIFWDGKPKVPEKISKYPYYADEDPLISYRLKPDWIYEKGKVVTNMHGFRIDRNLELEKKEENYRIAFLGDSVVFGTLTEEPETLTSYLQRRFNVLKYDSINRIVVLNFGVPGYNVSQYLGVLKKYALLYNPDFIIVGITVFNDFDGKKVEYLGNGYITRRIFSDINGYNYHVDSPSWLTWNSYFLRYRYYKRKKEALAEQRENLRPPVRVEHVDKILSASCDPNDPIWDLFKKQVAEFKRIADEKKINILFILFPTLEQVVFDDVSKEPQKIMKSVFNKMDIDYIDFYDSFNSYYDIAGLPPFRDYVSHPDDRMYEYVSTFIRDKIAKEHFSRPLNEYISEIDLGNRGDVKFISYGWSKRKIYNDRGIRWIIGDKARLIFNDFKTNLSSLVITCMKSADCNQQILEIYLNNQKAGEIDIDSSSMKKYRINFTEPVKLESLNFLDFRVTCAVPRNLTQMPYAVAVDRIKID